MRSPSFLATLFGFPREAPPSHKRAVHLHPHGDNIRYEVTVTRWAELLNGSARIGAGSDVLLDFEDVDCRAESADEAHGAAADWDGDEFDDDAEDLTIEAEEANGMREEEEVEEEVEEESRRARELWDTWAAADANGRRREREADVWRTRLGAEW